MSNIKETLLYIFGGFLAACALSLIFIPYPGIEGLAIAALILYLLIGFYFALKMAEHREMLVLIHPTVNPRTLYLINCPIVIFGWVAIVLAAKTNSR